MFLLVALLSFAVAQDSWDFTACKFTVKGVNYDLSALQQLGTVRFNQSIYKQDLSDEFVDAPPKATPYQWEVAVCANVKTNFASCTTLSPVNWVTADSATCTPIGDNRVVAIERTPYDDGLMMTFYHGKALNNIQEYSTRSRPRFLGFYRL